MKEKKQSQNTSSKIIIYAVMAIFLVLIALSAASSLRSGQRSKNIEDSKSEETNKIEEELEPTINTQIMAVIKEINLETGVVTLMDVDKDEELLVSFTSASNILDKYDQPMIAAKLEVGQMVDVYLGVENDLVTLQISKIAWEYLAATNLIYNTNAQAIMFNKVKYPYSDGILVFDGQVEIEVTDLHKTDYVTIRGNQDKICVISLTRGHGYLTLEGDEDYIGGIIFVGTSIEQEITEDMELVVKEGTFDVTVQKGSISGTKKITIPKNETIVFDVAEYGLPAIQMGRALFDITPLEAVLYVDGEETAYDEAVQLIYGEHEIEVALGGYLTYYGRISIDRTENNFTIALAEVTSEESESIEESESLEESEVNNNDEMQGSISDNTSDSINRDEESIEQEDEIVEEDFTIGQQDSQNSVDTAHKISIICTEGAKIYFDGTYKGTIEGGKLEVTKVIGTYSVELRLEGYESKVYMIQVEDDGQDATFRFPEF